MKKAAFVITALDFGGAENALIQLMGRIKEQYEDLPVIVLYAGGRMTAVLKGLDVRIIELHRQHPVFFLRPFYFILSFYYLRGLIYSEGITTLVTFLFEPAILSRIVKLFCRKKIRIINSIRASRQSMTFPGEVIYLFIERITSKICDRYVFVSRAALSYLASKTGLSVEKTEVIENGVDTGKFAFREKRTDYFISETGLEGFGFFVGTAGRLCSHKGFETFIETAKKVVPARKDICFVIQGEGETERKIRKLIKAAGLGKNIRIFPFSSRIADIYRGFDIFLSTSVSEGMSNTVLEAMSCGLPVVASDIPANRELISDGETGLLASKDDSDAFARAVIRLIDDPVLAARFGSESAKYIRQRFSADNSVLKWRQLLEKEIS